MAQRKNPQLDALHQSILRKMQQLPENRTCADCKAPSPRWASTNLGIFVCISCSGIHRRLGTHISQVRSTTLDTWTPAQIARFQKLGNAKAAAYFEACLPEGFRRPNSSDSMSMEKFIRDKYEKKRYITVENGGLGGASNERELRRAAPSNSLDPRNTTGKLGPRPSQSALKYDDIRGTVRKSAPLSYADTFRPPATSRNPPSSVTRTHMSSSFKPFTSSQTSLSKPGNAIQRASTVREIINMGFPADLAAKAAQAAEGDLQRAVDWVLANNNAAQQPPKQQVQPVMDLLDFGDSSPPAKTNGVPGATASELPLKPEVKTKPAAAADDDFTDFADFGAFESALPATGGVSSAKRSAPQTSPESLSSSIAGLYAQGMENAAASSFTQLQNVGKKPSPALPTAVSTPGGIPGSPQWATKSSATEISQVGRNQMFTNQSGNPTGNPRASPRRSPPSWNQTAQVRSAFLQKSPDKLRPSLGDTKTASPAGSPSQLHQHLPRNGTTTSSVMPVHGFSKLTSAGVARPGFSPKTTHPTAVQSTNHKLGITPPDAIPSFTWPTGSELSTSGTGADKFTAPVPNLGAAALSTTAGGLVPPPPPPPPEVQITGGEDAPPPPDGPPPAIRRNPNSASPHLGTVKQTEKSPTAEGASTHGDSAAGTESEEVEEEDPFAALSMLALSSATSMQTARKGNPVKSAKAAEASAASSAPVANESKGIDLDSLLG